MSVDLLELTPEPASGPRLGSASARAEPLLRPVTANWGRLAVYGLDWTERLIVVGLFGGLVVRLVLHCSTHGDIAKLILLPSEGLIVFFMLIRRATAEVSRQVSEWLLALAATGSVMFVIPGTGPGLLPPALAASIVLMGMLVQVHAKLTLGRSFGCVPAHRGLKLQGPYQFVRHPMYAGYLLSHLGFLAMSFSWWNLGVYALCYTLQVPRLLAEERLLVLDPRYRAYQAAVRYRLIPGLF